MIKQTTLRLLSVSLLGVCGAVFAPAVVMAESSTQETPGGTTTNFSASTKSPDAPTVTTPSANTKAETPAPTTTAAIPKPVDPPKNVLPEESAVSPKGASAASEAAPSSTAAVTPPASEAPAAQTAPTTGPATGDSKPVEATESKPAPAAAPTDTAIVTPPANDTPAASTEPAPEAAPSSDAKAEPEKKPEAAPATDTAQQPKPAETTPAATPVVTPPAPPPVSPVVLAARAKLSDKSFSGKSANEDVAAARDYYSAHTEPLWVKGGDFTHKAQEIIATLKGADDWGLESSDFVIPPLGGGSASEGAADAQLTLSALKYARYARGGRLDPVALSNILDMKPPVKDPKAAMRELASASDPGAYLRGLNPKHPGFERLRQALLKARGGEVADEPVDPALLVKIPARGRTLKRGVKDDQVTLLRQRLNVPAGNAADDRVYDDQLADAVRGFQQDNGLKANGVVTNRVRTALNNAGHPRRHADSSSNVDRILVNMERWRWLPVNLGSFYVMNNIPEYTSEIWQDNRIALKQKMIVGQPSWPTPLLTSKMQFVIFQPSWGMPDGIKAKELAPRLRQAANNNSGFGFFDQLFGGGGGGGNSGAQVIEAYKLQVYYNGQKIDPDSVNWRTADIRRYSFIQPPGPDNPLGLVKFRFPNKHDVYMHDTPERGLFSQSSRALSHGCMRVQDPRRTAEVILQEDKGYSPDKVGQLWNSGASVTLSKEVPVYLVYFTARVGDDGQMDNYSDIYGIDGRVMSALRGHPVRFQAQEAVDPTDDSGASASNDAGSDNLQDSRQNRRTAKKNTNNPLQDVLSNIFLN